jgi:putative redox protein
MTPRLATATVTTQRLNLPGRTIVNTKDHHLVVDSPLYLGGPNEEVNPMDLFLSALISHGIFLFEKIAQQMHIPLNDLRITAKSDFDPRGVLGESVDAGLRNLNLHILMSGPSEVQAKELTEAYTMRCPIYVTLARSVRIDLEVSLIRQPEVDVARQTA